MHRTEVNSQKATDGPPLPPDMNPNNPSVPNTPMCDLCRASKPAVRCDRCDNQVFCLQCDDIFHRHPKRKAHLRRSVDKCDLGRPPCHQGTTLVGHKIVPTKPFWKPQPDIPPRKKKPFSLFTNLMRGKSEACIPEEFEKRSTLSSKLGGLKRFIQNRPLPPLPNEIPSRQQPSYANSDEPKRSTFAFRHNKSGSASSLTKAYPRDGSDWEFEKDLGSNLQVNRMCSDRMALMNRHQSMMDLSRMSPQAYPQYLAGPGTFMPPFGTPFSGMALPYGSMSYLNDPRTIPQPWGYAGSTGSFSNLNSSAEGEGKDTDTESTSRTSLTGAKNSAVAASMRRCQSFAANQWNNMAYPYVLKPAFGYPGMLPYPYYFGENRWGSNQSMSAHGGVPANSPGLGSQLHPTNLDANCTPWYYQSRNKQRNPTAEMETSDSDLEFVPRSRYRSDFRQCSRPLSHDRDQPRPGLHGLRHSKSSAATNEYRHRRYDDISKAHLMGVSSADNFDEVPHLHQREFRHRRNERRTTPPPQEYYPDPIPYVSQSDDEDDIAIPPRFPSPPAANLFRKTSCEQAPRERLETASQTPMSPPRQRRQSSPTLLNAARLPAKEQCVNVALKAEQETASKPEMKVDSQQNIETRAPQANETSPLRIRWSPSQQWACVHCTFINEAGNRICEVCCKTSFKAPSPENQCTTELASKQECTPESTPAEVDSPTSAPSQRREPLALSKKKTLSDLPRKDIQESKNIDGFDYVFVKQQRTVEEELRRRFENERRIAAENAKLKASNQELVKVNDANAAPHDTYEMVKFASEPESESDMRLRCGRDGGSPAQSLTSRFERKIQLSKENSSTVVGPFRRMMVDPHGAPKAPSLINKARSKFETTPSQPRPRKSSLKTRDDITPSSSRSSLASSVEETLEIQGVQKARKNRSVQKNQIMQNTRKYEEQSFVEQVSDWGSTESESVAESEGESFVDSKSPKPAEFTRSTSKARRYRGFSRLHEDPTKPVSLTARPFKSVADLVDEQQQEFEKENALQLMNAIKEGETAGFSAEDVQVALNLCGDANPVLWLKTNWAHMIETVIHLSNTHVAENDLKNVGLLSVLEAQASLRRQSGNIWNSVLDAVEHRQQAFQVISSKGPFKAEDILQALRASQGNVDQALAQLSNSTMNAFLMKMFSAGAESLARSTSESTVAPDEKFTHWLENSKAVPGSESSALSSSSESLDLFAGSDQQLQKLDKLLMKRHIQKKEDSRYKKYKERLAYAKQHQEAALLGESSHFGRNLRPSVSSTSSLETSASQMSNFEQKLQTGLNTILSAIETTLKRERQGLSTDENMKSPESSKHKLNKHGFDSSSGKPRTTRGTSEPKDYEKPLAVASDVPEGPAVKPKTRTRCNRPSPTRHAETESNDDYPGKAPPANKPFKTPTITKAAPGSREKKTEREYSEGNKVKNVESEPKRGNTTQRIVSNTTESENSAEDQDYSEVELAMATVHKPAIMNMPLLPHTVVKHSSEKEEESEEEFEAAEEFLNAPQSSPIHRDTRAEVETYSEAFDVSEDFAPDQSEPTAVEFVSADGITDNSSQRLRNDLVDQKIAISSVGSSLPLPNHPGRPEAPNASLAETVLGSSGLSKPARVKTGHQKQTPQQAVATTSLNSAASAAADSPEPETVERHQRVEVLHSVERGAPTHPSSGDSENEQNADSASDHPSRHEVLEGPTLPYTDNPGHHKLRVGSQTQVERSNPSPSAFFAADMKSSTDDGQLASNTVTKNPKLSEGHVFPLSDEFAEETGETGLDIDNCIKNEDHSGSEENSEAFEEIDAFNGKPEYVDEEQLEDGNSYRSHEDSENEDHIGNERDPANKDDLVNGELNIRDNNLNRTEEETRDHAVFPEQEDATPLNRDLQQEDDDSNNQNIEDQAKQLGESMEIACDLVEEVLEQTSRSQEIIQKQANFTESELSSVVAEETSASQTQTAEVTTASKPKEKKKSSKKQTQIEEEIPPKVDEISAMNEGESHVHNSDDYSDVSDDETESSDQRISANPGNQAAMMQVIRRSLDDLARLGGKPQKLASRHVVYRRPSIRRRSTIVVVDRGDGFGRSSEGDAIIIKPQNGLEKTLRVSGQELTKVILGMVAKQRTRPPPKRKVADASKLQQMLEQRPTPRHKQLQFNEKARELVATGRVANIIQAHMVAELVDMNFDEDDAILASANTESVYQAVLFLQQECNLCYGTYPISQMIALLHCAHVACQECMRTYFTIQIRDRNVGEIRCPFCNEPDLSDEKIEQNYFSNMSELLKGLVDKETYDLFQKKLVERALIKDPNFRWCPQCSSGFITVAKQKAVTCPDCKKVSCVDCKKIWRKEHQTLSCEEFGRWISHYEPDSAELGLEKYFEENGIQCPECKFCYALSRGGCMHFKCLQCGFDFCSGCNRPFKNGEKCGFSVNCKRMGLHAHHPRNCLFYLRDKEPEKLEQLLKIAGVPITRDLTSGANDQTRCQVPETKESALGGYKDGVCDREVEPNMAGLCKKHYVEYLGNLIFRHKVDPATILETEELELCIRRANMRLPSRYQLTADVYKDVLLKYSRQLIQTFMKTDVSQTHDELYTRYSKRIAAIWA